MHPAQLMGVHCITTQQQTGLTHTLTHCIQISSIYTQISHTQTHKLTCCSTVTPADQPANVYSNLLDAARHKWNTNTQKRHTPQKKVSVMIQKRAMHQLMHFFVEHTLQICICRWSRPSSVGWWVSVLVANLVLRFQSCKAPWELPSRTLFRYVLGCIMADTSKVAGSKFSSTYTSAGGSRECVIQITLMETYRETN